MPVTITSNGVSTTVQLQSETVATVQVQTGAPRGEPGTSPNRSIYDARGITVVAPTVILDASVATTFYLTLQTNVTSFSVINWPNDSKSQRLAIYIEQDSVGNRLIQAWPNNTKWSYGQQPVLTPLPNAIDCVVLDTFDGGFTIFGGVVGLNFS